MINDILWNINSSQNAVYLLRLNFFSTIVTSHRITLLFMTPSETAFFRFKNNQILKNRSIKNVAKFVQKRKINYSISFK